MYKKVAFALLFCLCCGLLASCASNKDTCRRGDRIRQTCPDDKRK